MYWQETFKFTQHKILKYPHNTDKKMFSRNDMFHSFGPYHLLQNFHTDHDYCALLVGLLLKVVYKYIIR